MCRNLQEKWRAPILGTAFRASLRNRNAHGHFTRAILCGNLQEKCRTPIVGTAFCASLRGRNAHVHLRRTILCGPDAPDTTSIKHRALTLSVSTPSVWPRCVRKNTRAHFCRCQENVLANQSNMPSASKNAMPISNDLPYQATIRSTFPATSSFFCRFLAQMSQCLGKATFFFKTCFATILLWDYPSFVAQGTTRFFL